MHSLPLPVPGEFDTVATLQEIQDAIPWRHTSIFHTKQKQGPVQSKKTTDCKVPPDSSSVKLWGDVRVGLQHSCNALGT